MMSKSKNSGRARLIFLVASLVASLLLAGCAGKDGNSYQKFWWSGDLGYLYDTNPSTPATVYNDVYFPTKDGDFYVQYQAYDGSEWYGYYTITVDKGKPLMQAGDDFWFELDLYSYGPSLYKWSSSRAGMAQRNSNPNATQAGVASPSASIVSNRNLNLKPGPELGTEVFTSSAGTVKLRYGKMIASE